MGTNDRQKDEKSDIYVPTAVLKHFSNKGWLKHLIKIHPFLISLKGLFKKTLLSTRLMPELKIAIEVKSVKVIVNGEKLA